MGPFSITGQPNAMGGREVGGLANMLAAHMELGDAAHRAHRADVLGVPAIAARAGLKAVDLFEAIHDGPDQGRLDHGDESRREPARRRPGERALATLRTRGGLRLRRRHRYELRSRTCCCPRPAGARRTARSPTPSGASRVSAPSCRAGRSEARLVDHLRVARRMGYGGLRFLSPACTIFSTSTRGLSAYRNRTNTARETVPDESRSSARSFRSLCRPRRGAHEPLAADAHRADPVAGARVERRPGHRRALRASSAITRYRQRRPRALHRDAAARPGQRDRRRLPARAQHRPRARPVAHDDAHRQVREARGRHTPEPLRRHASAGRARMRRARRRTRARVERWGSMVARVQHGGGMPARQRVRADPLERAGRVRCARRRAGESGRRSGFRRARVQAHAGSRGAVRGRLARLRALGRRSRAASTSLTYWTRVQGAQFVRYEIAGRELPTDWRAWANSLFSAALPGSRLAAGARQRFAICRRARLRRSAGPACSFRRTPNLPARSWLAGLFEREALEDAERRALLIGQPADSRDADPGPTVCSCFSVGRNQIVVAIREQGLHTPQKRLARRSSAAPTSSSCSGAFQDADRRHRRRARLAAAAASHSQGPVIR